MKFARIAFAFSVIASMAGVACHKSEPQAQPASDTATVTEATAEPAPVPTFQPPPGGLLTPPQVEKFLLAHQALLKINEMYLDRLAAAKPADRRAILAAMDLAREKSARKFGLNGYEEYRWILEVAPSNPQNKRILEQMQVSVVGG